MAQSTQHSKKSTKATAIPAVSMKASRFFQQYPSSFAYLDKKLRGKDHILADFILARAGELVPNAEDIPDREAIAKLALEVWDLLLYQAETNHLRELFTEADAPKIAMPPTSDADALS